MTQNKNQNVIFLSTSNLYGYTMSKFPPTGRVKWISSKEFDLDKYTSNKSKESVVEVDLEYPKNYKNNAMLYEYQLKIANLYNVSMGDVKRTSALLFWWRRVSASLRELTTLLEIRIKTKKKFIVS